jgi:signal peptidase II
VGAGEGRVQGRRVRAPLTEHPAPDSPMTDGDRPTEVSRPPTHRVLFGAVLVGWLLLDQLSKTWVENSLTSRDIDLVGSLRFNLAYNTGTAFSLGGGLGPWIAVVALVVVGVLVWQGRSVRTRLGAVALAMIVGGALGNIGDRAFRGGAGFMHGAVIDFIDLQWWPIFNVADMGIVVGGILLVISSLRAPAEVAEPDAAEPDRVDSDALASGGPAVEPDDGAASGRSGS